jgi:hypothetical protein
MPTDGAASEQIGILTTSIMRKLNCRKWHELDAGTDSD